MHACSFLDLYRENASLILTSIGRMILRMIALNLIQCYNAILEMQVRNINICTRSRTRKVTDGNSKFIYLFNFFLLHFLILFLQVVQSKYYGKKKAHKTDETKCFFPDVPASNSLGFQGQRLLLCL